MKNKRLKNFNMKYPDAKFALLFFALAAAVFACYLFNIHVPCLIKYLTGFPCPACGMSRALICALHGDFSAAFRFHPLFWILPLDFILYVCFAFSKGRARKFFLYLIFLSVAALLVIYMIRMIIMFPDTPPMDYDKNAVLPKTAETSFSVRASETLI